MEIKKIQLLDFDLREFKSIIKSVVTSVLQENKELFLNSNKEYSDVYLNRKEAAEFLKTSMTNLWSLDKSQKLPARRLNGKVLYLKSDLLNFFNTKA